MRWLVAAVVATGCSSEPKDCSVPTVFEQYLGSAAVDDCGNLNDDGLHGSDVTVWQAAQQCALDHAAQQRPFRVTWFAQALEGPFEGAYVGMVRDGAWQLAGFYQAAQITGKLPPTRTDSCTALSAMSPCNEIQTQLCIECSGRTASEQCMP